MLKVTFWLSAQIKDITDFANHYDSLYKNLYQKGYSIPLCSVGVPKGLHEPVTHIDSLDLHSDIFALPASHFHS